MPLTPEDVRNKQFTTVRLREGYDEDEVDAFLDEVEAELTRLLRENEDLRAKLAAATRAAAQNQQQGMRKPEQQDGRGPGAPRPGGHIRPGAGPAAADGSAPAARRPSAACRPQLDAAGRSHAAGPRPDAAGRPHGADGPGPHGSGSDGPRPDGPRP